MNVAILMLTGCLSSKEVTEAARLGAPDVTVVNASSETFAVAAVGDFDADGFEDLAVAGELNRVHLLSGAALWGTGLLGRDAFTQDIADAPVLMEVHDDTVAWPGPIEVCRTDGHALHTAADHNGTDIVVRQGDNLHVLHGPDAAWVTTLLGVVSDADEDVCSGVAGVGYGLAVLDPSGDVRLFRNPGDSEASTLSVEDASGIIDLPERTSVLPRVLAYAFDTLAVGVHDRDETDGSVLVFRSVSTSSELTEGDADAVLAGNPRNSNMGYSVVVGNFYGPEADDVGDLLVTALVPGSEPGDVEAWQFSSPAGALALDEAHARYLAGSEGCAQIPGDSPVAEPLGDVNGDGRTDFALGDAFEEGACIVTTGWSGRISLEHATWSADGGAARGWAAAGDLDADGCGDIAVNADGEVRIYLARSLASSLSTEDTAISRPTTGDIDESASFVWGCDQGGGADTG